MQILEWRDGVTEGWVGLGAAPELGVTVGRVKSEVKVGDTQGFCRSEVLTWALSWVLIGMGPS